MKALSLTRPWTTLVLHEGKQVENRTWTTSYRGPLLIHGAKSWADDVPGRAADLGIRIAGSRDEHPTGYLGVVDLIGVCEYSRDSMWDLVCDCAPWGFPGQHHWQLANPRPFRQPIPGNGRLGLWTPSPDLADQVSIELAKAVLR
ncbi:MAG: ASCH domain-containing protein [Actinomycetota bacterium]|nr:ASCH domain-containing protein [Actinomycetota bacterium]